MGEEKKVGRPKGSKNQGGWLKRVERQRAKAKEQMWRKGLVYWKLDDNQKFMYDYYKNAHQNLLVWVLSRQIGKTWTVSCIAIEEAMQNPNFKIAYVLPKQNQARRLIKSTFNQILVDCPEDIKPNFKTQDNIWEFNNGSEIYCVGTDAGNIENVRGMRFDLIIMDECGFMDGSEFHYYYKSVLFPTMTTAKRKMTIMITTPPKSSGHAFNQYIDLAIMNKSFLRRTIYDCPRFGPKDIKEMADSVGGTNTIDFRREYLAERIADINALVIPEATKENLEEIIGEWDRPPFSHKFVGGDFGNLDWTAFVFGYYDFRQDMIVIEDELIFKGTNFTTEDMARAIRQKEQELWTDKNGLQENVYMRVADNNAMQIIIDFNNIHNLTFVTTHKDDKHAQINNLRMKIGSRRIKINPRCEKLIFHIANATWDKNRKKYEKGLDGSHYDLLDALLYMVRNINFHDNPYPKDYDLPKGWFISPYRKNKHLDEFGKTMKDLFTVKKRKKK